MRTAFFLISLALAAGPVAATPAGAAAREVPLTLDEALALAGTDNPELGAAAARAEVQVALTESVRRNRWPRVGLTAGWSYTDLPASVFANKLNAGAFTEQDFDIARLNDPDALDQLATTLSVAAPLDLFGQIRTRVEAQSAQADAAAAGTQDVAQEIRYRVIAAYRRAELAARALDVTARALAVARAREEQLTARVDAGAALEAELLRARTRRRQREADLAERRGEHRIALAGLARVLGAPADVSYVPAEAPPPVPPLEGEEETWIERALAARPALVAARRRTDAASSAVRSERVALRPELGVFGQLHDNRLSLSDGEQAWAVGVGLNWLPFDPARSQREAAARAEQRAAEEDARAAIDQVRLEVASAYRRAAAARERHQAAAGGAEEAREALRVMQERRAAGVATLTDELETEAAALGAALDEIAAAAEVAIADAALRRAAGEI